MAVVLLFARNLRSANAHATTEQIPWTDRLYISRPEQIRGLGTKGVARRFYPGWETHPLAREIADCLYVCDMVTSVREAV